MAGECEEDDYMSDAILQQWYYLLKSSLYIRSVCCARLLVIQSRWILAKGVRVPIVTECNAVYHFSDAV